MVRASHAQLIAKHVRMVFVRCATMGTTWITIHFVRVVQYQVQTSAL